MTDVKNYATGDHVHDHSELSLQISNGIIILFPLISLFCIKLISPRYRPMIAIILFLAIIEGMFSVANHMYHEHDDDIDASVFAWLDVAGVIILGILSFLLIFDIILKNSNVENVQVKILYRVFYIVTALFMIGSYIYAQICRKNMAKTLTQKQKINIYNQYHNIWHLGGAMLIVIVILYTFTFHTSK
jgi:hypothetical protein